MVTDKQILFKCFNQFFFGNFHLVTWIRMGCNLHVFGAKFWGSNLHLSFSNWVLHFCPVLIWMWCFDQCHCQHYPHIWYIVVEINAKLLSSISFVHFCDDVWQCDWRGSNTGLSQGWHWWFMWGGETTTQIGKLLFAKSASKSCKPSG